MKITRKDYENIAPAIWLTLAVAIASITAGSAIAQDDSEAAAAADSEELQRLKEKAEIAETEQRIAVANAATAKAEGSDTAGLAGDVEVGEGTGYFAEVLAYQSLDRAAEEIAQSVGGSATKFILTNSFDLNRERALWETLDLRIGVFETRFSDLETRLEKERKRHCQDDDTPIPGGAPVPAVATSLVTLAAGLGALSDVLGFFRTDTKLSAYDVTLSDNALLAGVASHLIEQGHTVFIPALHGGAGGNITKRVSALQSAAANIDAIRERIKKCASNDWKQVEQLEKEIEQHKKAKDDAKRKAAEAKLKALLAKELLKLRKFAESEVPKAKSALTEFFNKLTSPVKEGQPSPIEMVATVDAIKEFPNASFLYLDIVGQGGEVHTSKSVWTGGRVSYIGGSTSVFFLTDGTGSITKSGTNSKFKRGWYGNRGGVKGLETE